MFGVRQQLGRMGRRMRKFNGRHHVGDLLVEIQVEVPRKLTERQEELLRELADLEESDVMPHKRSFFEQVKHFFSGSDEEDDD